MPNAFNNNESPFDCLTPQEQRLVRDSVDVVYFPEGAVVLEVGAAPTHLFVVIKGYVKQLEGSELITTYGPDDTFDGRGLVAGKASSRFVAVEEVVAYQLAKQAVSDLIASNATFGALLFSELSNKLSALSQRKSQHEMQSLSMARVDEAFLRPAHFVDAATDILSVVRLFQERRVSNVLVRDESTQPPRLGIFTATTVQRAVLDGRPLEHLAVGEFSNFELVTARNSDQLGDAMTAMMRANVHRVVVQDESLQILGILEALDMFSFMSNHSHLITMRIEQAEDLHGLNQAAAQITRMISMLYRGGSRVNLIARIVQQLNARLFERAWHLIAPPELVKNSCLYVMGSEGRGEQLLKTDQDNGLLLREGYEPPADLAEICQRFSQALSDFGYPECQGQIMLSNPEWRATTGEFTQRARQWLLMPDADALMKLAIFMDAHAICGDVRLLHEVQSGLRSLAVNNDSMIGRFAAAIDAFSSGTGWWNRLLGLGDGSNYLNLKKEGVFPLVHGVRSLALAHRIRETGTVERLTGLVAAGVLSAEIAADLTDSLHFFMGLKLKAGLAEIDVGKPVVAAIDVSRLNSLDRDLLKDTLGVVKRFKVLLHQRFHLDTLG